MYDPSVLERQGLRIRPGIYTGRMDSAMGIASRTRVLPLFFCVLCLPVGALAQGGPLYINEVITANASTPPADIGGEFSDMIEIYNDSDEEIDLGGVNPYCLTDSAEFEIETAWCFPDLIPYNAVIPPKGFLIVFCDGNPEEFNEDGLCELHANFRIDADGGEPISLWRPQRPDGSRELVDQVWLPPLDDDVSFGRYPDGAGPTPVPVEEVLEVFRFNPPGSATFGECQNRDGDCFPGGLLRMKRNVPGSAQRLGGEPASAGEAIRLLDEQPRGRRGGLLYRRRARRQASSPPDSRRGPGQHQGSPAHLPCR